MGYPCTLCVITPVHPTVSLTRNYFWDSIFRYSTAFDLRLVFPIFFHKYTLLTMQVSHWHSFCEKKVWSRLAEHSIPDYEFFIES